MKERGYEVFPISAATHEGVQELILYLSKKLEEIPYEPIVEESMFEKEPFVDEEQKRIVVRRENDYYIIEGAPIEKLFILQILMMLIL